MPYRDDTHLCRYWVVGKSKHAGLVVLVGSSGLVAGRAMAANGHTDPGWTKDTDFQTALVLGTILVVVAVWNLRRAAIGKLLVIVFLTLGGVIEALWRINRDDPPGPGGGAGVGLERVGLVLMVVAGVVTGIGITWSATLTVRNTIRTIVNHPQPSG